MLASRMRPEAPHNGLKDLTVLYGISKDLRCKMCVAKYRNVDNGKLPAVDANSMY